MNYHQPQPAYYPVPAAPYPPWVAPPSVGLDVDLKTLSLDELLEQYAYARQGHRQAIAECDSAEKQAAQLRDREQEVKRALVSALDTEWKDKLRSRLVDGGPL